MTNRSIQVDYVAHACPYPHPELPNGVAECQFSWTCPTCEQRWHVTVRTGLAATATATTANRVKAPASSWVEQMKARIEAAVAGKSDDRGPYGD